MAMGQTQTIRKYFIAFVLSLLLTPAQNKSNSKNYYGIRLKRHACERTPTEVNGKVSCKGKLIFEDNFDGPQLDSRRWTPDRQIAGLPDYDFTWLTDEESNLFLRDGLLFLKPTLVNSANDFLTNGTLDLRNKGCTSPNEEDCFQKAWLYNILPPVQSARITSKGKFSFKYGVIEVRCKLPEGFWLYPPGVVLEVDRKRVGQFRPPPLGFGAAPVAGPAEAEAWGKGERMAPFDQEFYITLGLGVGGQHAFPDGVKSADIPKPWKNSDVKMKLQFIQEKTKWKDTWAWDDAALQVDYVRVWAL